MEKEPDISVIASVQNTNFVHSTLACCPICNQIVPNELLPLLFSQCRIATLLRTWKNAQYQPLSLEQKFVFRKEGSSIWNSTVLDFDIEMGIDQWNDDDACFLLESDIEFSSCLCVNCAHQFGWNILYDNRKNNLFYYQLPCCQPISSLEYALNLSRLLAPSHHQHRCIKINNK